MANAIRNTLFVAIGTLIGFTANAAGSSVPAASAAPKAAPSTLPMNAQVSNGSVYVPISKSGNVGVSVGPHPNPLPGEKGGSVSLTIKTR